MKKECLKCGAKCCKVFYLPPRFLVQKEIDKEFVEWFNYHEKATIIKWKGEYWMRFELKCEKLKNNRCSIYKNRPEETCKEFDCDKGGWDYFKKLEKLVKSKSK